MRYLLPLFALLALAPPLDAQQPCTQTRTTRVIRNQVVRVPPDSVYLVYVTQDSTRGRCKLGTTTQTVTRVDTVRIRDTVRVVDTVLVEQPGPVTPPPPPPAPEPEQPPPSGAGLVFASDWSTLGTTTAAVTDGGKWTAHNAYSAGWASVVARNAAGVPTTGNVPTRGNVLRVHYNRGGDIAIPNGIPTVAVGSSFYVGIRVAVSIRNAAGNLSSSPHHPLQPLQGSCAHEWSLKIGPRSDGTYELILATAAGYPNNGWYRGTLPKFTWDGWGLRFTRVAANSYRIAVQRNGADDGANWVRYDGRPSDNLAALNPTFPISDACARNLFLGNNGPGWPTLDPNQDHIHWATLEVRTDRWPE